MLVLLVSRPAVRRPLLIYDPYINESRIRKLLLVVESRVHRPPDRTEALVKKVTPTIQRRFLREGTIIRKHWIDKVLKLDGATRVQVVVGLLEEPGPVRKRPGQ